MTVSEGDRAMANQSAGKPGGAAGLLKELFLRLGVLPFFLVVALIVFALVSTQFLSLQNLTNVARQSVYLVLVSLGQMLVLKRFVVGYIVASPTKMRALTGRLTCPGRAGNGRYMNIVVQQAIFSQGQ